MAFFFVMILVSIMTIVLAIFCPTTARLWHAAVGVVLFSFFIIYDTQIIVGGKHRQYELDDDRYILGSVLLYLDIINLFLEILRLLGGKE